MHKMEKIHLFTGHMNHANTTIFTNKMRKIICYLVLIYAKMILQFGAVCRGTSFIYNVRSTDWYFKIDYETPVFAHLVCQM